MNDMVNDIGSPPKNVIQLDYITDKRKINVKQMQTKCPNNEPNIINRLTSESVHKTRRTIIIVIVITRTDIYI